MTASTGADERAPCPFCGSLKLHFTSNGAETNFLECVTCGTSGPAEAHEEKAIAAWNRRASLGAAQVPAEPVAEVVLTMKMPGASPAWKPHKIIHASLAWFDANPVGTKLYAQPNPDSWNEAIEAVVKRIEGGSFLHDKSPAKLFANELAPVIRSMKRAPISAGAAQVPSLSEITDEFRGDNDKLVECIGSLLRLDAKGALVPHGIGGFARDLLSAAAVRIAALSQPSAGAAQVPSLSKCKRCGGAGVVDDGEITGSGGVMYENGPVKCVKDCPLCKPEKASPRHPPHLHISELLRIYDERGGDWCRIAREVEERTIAAFSQPSQQGTKS